MKKRQLTALAAAMLISINSSAALVTENLTVTAITGDYSGTTGTGSFTYDDSLITGVGEEAINAIDGLSIELNVFGQAFFESNEIDYPDYPVLSFVDGNIITLDFIVSEEGALCFDCSGNTTVINQEGILDFSIYNINVASGGGYEGELYVNDSVSAVPVPAAVWLFGSGLIGLAGVARRKKS